MKIFQLAQKAQRECQKTKKLENKFQKDLSKCDDLMEQIKKLQRKLSDQERKTASTSDELSVQRNNTQNAIRHAQQEYDANHNDLAANGSEHLVDGWETFKIKNSINLEY